VSADADCAPRAVHLRGSTRSFASPNTGAVDRDSAAAIRRRDQNPRQVAIGSATGLSVLRRSRTTPEAALLILSVRSLDVQGRGVRRNEPVSIHRSGANRSSRPSRDGRRPGVRVIGGERGDRMRRMAGPSTYKLDWSKANPRTVHQTMIALYRDLLALRGRAHA